MLHFLQLVLRFVIHINTLASNWLYLTFFQSNKKGASLGSTYQQ
jgi:hypothetical protein